jgi:hypothetical protein
MKKDEKAEPRPCANVGCTREARPGHALCDTCDLEWVLYRRDLRPPVPSPRP